MNLKLAVLLVAALAAPLPSSAAGILPVSEVHKGMKGYGLTIFQGTEVERFDVEILGVLNKIGPGQDLILARVDHKILEKSGVIAGMSGSPIFIDGKLIGALAYSWQFAAEPVAGITPIEQMLALEKNVHRGAGGAVPVKMSTLLEGVLDPKSNALEALAAPFKTPRVGAAGVLPVATPLSFSNFSSETIDRFSPMFEAGGFMPVPAGTMSGGSVSAVSSRPFAPGDSIGAVLLEGDFSVAATGTVTHVDGDRVWAFGHPFLDMGEIDFPMALSEVVTVFPSLARSFKFANTGATVGALRQDRNAGILGYVGQQSEMIPVELSIDGARGSESYKFRLARHPMLSPLLLAMVADSVVAIGQRAAGERTIMLESEIQIEGLEPIQGRDAWAGAEARQAIPVYLAVISSYLLSNEFEERPIRSIKLRLRHEDDLKLARVTRAAVETPADGEINPGDTIRVRTVLKPYRGEEFIETFELKVPSTVKPGSAYVFVGSGRMATRLDFSLVPPDPHSLAQAIGVLERLQSAADLTVGLYALDDGAVSAGVYHPSLPPSMHAVVAADSSNAAAAAVKVGSPSSQSRPLDYIVDGAVRIDVQIRPRV